MSQILSQIVSRLAHELKWNRLRTPDDLVGAWRQFVDECAAGYPLGIDEYENDLSVRSMIDKVLQADDLPADPSVDAFVDAVRKDDERFKRLLQTDVLIRSDGLPWWNRGVPRYAGAELADDFAGVHGAHIAVV
jgi:hypothetical protein